MIPRHPPPITGLKAFFNGGLEENNEEVEGMDNLFDGKTSNIMMPPTSQLRAEKLEYLRLKKEKDEKKNIKVERIRKTS